MQETIVNIKEKLKHLTVLFVEDEDDLRVNTENFLKFIFDDIDVAKNGKEGLELFQKKNYNIVITDIIMPLMDGIQMCKEIVKINSNTAIIFLTAYRDNIDQTDLKYNYLVQKPISYNKMLETIQKLSTEY